MIDGSKLPLDDNVALSARVVEAARRAGVSVEGEVGVVGYVGGAPSLVTAPEDAARLERECGLDALAVSVGNVHLSEEKASDIDLDALAAIEAHTRVPLVLHGGSGIPVPTAPAPGARRIGSPSSTSARSYGWRSARPCAPISLRIPEALTASKSSGRPRRR